MAATERVLVTGGAGFIGAALVHALVADAAQVHLILRPGSTASRLAGVMDAVTVHRADLRDAGAVALAVAGARPDVVYHLAAHGVYPDQVDEAAVLATNVLGTAHLLAALRRHDYRVLVQTGSAAEYGGGDRPFREDDPVSPRTAYGVAKAAATLLCRAEDEGQRVVTVRVFTTYGPGEVPSRLVAHVMGCCLHGRRPRVSTGSQVRDFVHVTDVIELLLRAAGCASARGQVLHAGTGTGHTVREVVETVLSVCGGQLQAEYGSVPLRTGEVPLCVADIRHTTEIVGWKPELSLRAGVERTWQCLTSASARVAA